MTSPETADSPQLKLVHSFVEGFKNRDMDHIARLLHKDHRRITYPRSVGKPEQNKEEYLQHTAEIMKLWTSSEVSRTWDCSSNPLSPTKSISQPTVHSVVEAPGKVVMHVRIINVQINTPCLNT